MTTIHEELEEFLHMDGFEPQTTEPNPEAYNQNPHHDPLPSTDPDMDLVLSNVNEDDFSFWALQHFSDQTGETGAPAEIETTALNPECWGTPEAPCSNCILGGYQCKSIQEGKYKGYCTSCVALRTECSFASSRIIAAGENNLDSSVFPPNPWPTLGDHPNTIPYEDLSEVLPSTSAPEPPSLTASSSTENINVSHPKASPMPKIGARFSRESVRILKNWLSSHSRHPYPSDEEKEMLQRQTGLSKIQITNWLANARRRGKIIPPRSTSPHIGAWSAPIDIPGRRGTPALERMGSNMSNMNPLERWVDSPPENEPASVTAIARAVTASSSSAISSGLNSPYSFNYTDDGTGRSIGHGSSASSAGTSHSSGGGSFNSAYSQGSRGSFGSLGSFNRGRRRRRRRNALKHPEEKTSLAAPLKTFQCTFCTESFRTKHDWQRHEKSLHLSLERWVCAPDGPRALNPETNQLCCVFCGEVNPDDAHLETHNFSTCQEKSLSDRTFYRKDHLNQHLKLVHNVKFLDWAMKLWKVATPEIRSRCGFCGIVMDTWTIRVDHLAEHFKTGNTMKDWKGDWGFEAPVLEMVENSIPPYLIHDERNSPLPFVASMSPPESPRNAYELIKMELVYFASNLHDTTRRLPTDQEMQLEACRIIFASEVLSIREISSMFSWLRDLIMASDEVAQAAKFGPLRGPAENRLSILKINGKDNLFESCPLEAQLQEFVVARGLLGLTAMDAELQVEACKIVGRMEEISTNPSDLVANWLVRMIYSSPEWLANFRQRASLPRSEDLGDMRLRSTDPKTIDSTIYNYSRLERELGDYLAAQRSLGIEPDDADLQRQARIIIYEFDDGWNQTAADSAEWLSGFRQRHVPGTNSLSDASSLTLSSMMLQSPQATSSISGSGNMPLNQGGELSFFSGNSSGESILKTSPFFLNDANCYRRLEKQLRRWVAATMSANNPNQHVPSDEELQHQARWILYDNDDPFNQTAADNAEWLLRFKRDVGIIKEDGPGLPRSVSWSIEQGGTGFAPPYAYPQSQMAPFTEEKVEVGFGEGAKSIEASTVVANKFLETFTTRYPRPATIFCSRELETGLVDFVQQQTALNGSFPDDASLQAKAREILKTDTTAAEDPALLKKFKEWMAEKVPQPTMTEPAQPSVLPTEMDLNFSDEQINDILQDMDINIEFDTELGGASLEGNTTPAG